MKIKYCKDKKEGIIEKGCLVNLCGVIGDLLSQTKVFKILEVIDEDFSCIEISMNDAYIVEEKYTYFDIADIETLGNNKFAYRIENYYIGEINFDIKSNCKKEKNNIKKGGVKMNNNMINKMFNFGAYEGNDLAITMEGEIAVKREDGDYVRYNSVTNEFENKMEFVIDDLKEMIMLMPVSVLSVGDIILKSGKFYQLVEENENLFIDLEDGSKVQLLKEKNMFGMELYTKVTNIIKDGFNFNQNVTQEDNNPMGGMFQMMMMSKIMGKDSGDSSGIDMKKMMLMSMMNNQGNQGGFNPMMFMLMK